MSIYSVFGIRRKRRFRSISHILSFLLKSKWFSRSKKLTRRIFSIMATPLIYSSKKKFKKTKSLKLSDFHYYSRIVTWSYPSNLENFRSSILWKKILRTLPIDVLGGKLSPRKNGGCLEKLDFGELFWKFKMFNFESQMS